MSELTVYGIFQTPVAFGDIDRPFTKDELKEFTKIGKDVVRINAGGVAASKDTHVLERPELAKLKEDILHVIYQYMFNVMKTPPDVEPVITQSWTNYLNANEAHPKHLHQNSYISGVLYIDADENHDKIHFYNDTYRQLTVTPTEFNQFNSESWWFQVKTGQVALFPSHLLHMVEPKHGKNKRVSLAFNVFLTGTLGDERMLTELKL